MNKKGFTLIELLAVITVLAIIIMITTPIILGVIDDAKKNAAQDSMYLYIKAIEMSVNANPKVAGLLEGTYVTKDANLYTGSTKALEVQSKGDKPLDNGTVVMKTGDVEEARLSFGGYIVVYKNKKATIEGDADSKPANKIYAVGEEVYFNPVTGAKCTKGQEWTFSNKSSNCYRWNVITMNDNGNNTKVELLLDHNIVTDTPYHDNNNFSGPSTTLWNKIVAITGSWKNVDIFTSDDNIQLSGYRNPYIIDYTGKKVKVPSTSSIVSLAGKSDLWTPGGNPVSLSGTNFLFNNLTSNADGTYCYWTDQGFLGDSVAMWVVDGSQLYNDYWARFSEVYCGFRPVIRISKANL